MTFFYNISHSLSISLQNLYTFKVHRIITAVHILATWNLHLLVSYNTPDEVGDSARS